ncbi:MAG: hypothetical protein AAB499_01345 [Patescibacteria group bacterium]
MDSAAEVSTSFKIVMLMFAITVVGAMSVLLKQTNLLISHYDQQAAEIDTR